MKSLKNLWNLLVWTVATSQSAEQNWDNVHEFGRSTAVLYRGLCSLAVFTVSGLFWVWTVVAATPLWQTLRYIQLSIRVYYAEMQSYNVRWGIGPDAYKEALAAKQRYIVAHSWAGFISELGGDGQVVLQLIIFLVAVIVSYVILKLMVKAGWHFIQQLLMLHSDSFYCDSLRDFVRKYREEAEERRITEEDMISDNRYIFFCREERVIDLID